jgi:glycosyltransferase involved in cell wall biosynthesis
LDLEIFNFLSKPARELRDAETITIGCIGRSEPEKGTKYVLNAFEVLFNQDDRYELKVAYGNLPDDWSHERCEVVTPKNDLELAKFYKSLDILIAPGTVQHGAPHYPVLEAMACGIPVVTTGYYGADNTTAWIVENKSSSSIVSAVSAITNDREQTCIKSLKALQFAQQLGWEIVSAKMMQCFNQFTKNI